MFEGLHSTGRPDLPPQSDSIDATHELASPIVTVDGRSQKLLAREHVDLLAFMSLGVGLILFLFQWLNQRSSKDGGGHLYRERPVASKRHIREKSDADCDC